jgi:hypothetical protein
MDAATLLSSGRLAGAAVSLAEPTAAAILLSSGRTAVGEATAAATALSSGPPSARAARDRVQAVVVAYEAGLVTPGDAPQRLP